VPTESGKLPTGLSIPSFASETGSPFSNADPKNKKNGDPTKSGYETRLKPTNYFNQSKAKAARRVVDPKYTMRIIRTIIIRRKGNDASKKIPVVKNIIFNDI
jgi:hypothetical protein